MRRKSGHSRFAPPSALLALAVLVAVLVLLASGCGCGAPATTSPVSAEAVTSSFSSTTQPPVTVPATPPVTQSPPAQLPSTALLVKGAPGSSGSGDPYFPAAGNGGYEVRSYDIALDIDPVSGRVTGDETVVAGALQDLSAFNLDLRGLTVAEVQVDGVTAPFERRGDELAVTFPAAVRAGVTFTVAIRYSGIPETMYAKQFNMGWQRIGDTIFTIDEPLGAATWFAVNDTPADKATYTFSLTVPAEYTATANGVLTGTETAGASRTFHWRMDQPMSSYLAQVAVDRFTLETSTSAGGVPIRNYFAEEIAPVASKAFARTGDVLDYYASLFGPYPFLVYGSVVLDAASGAAMENQTLSLYGRDVVEKRMLDPVTGAIYLSHELAHQWFGDSVTLERWDDIWLNEGFATYASWLWLEHDLGPQALLDQVTLSEQLVAKSLEPPPGTPGPDHLFGTSVYRRGALTLHALRLTVGDEAFFGILRAWADAYEYGTAETTEFIALVKERAPQVPAAELDALFEAWLYGEKVPALPGAVGSFAN